MEDHWHSVSLQFSHLMSLVSEQLQTLQSSQGYGKIQVIGGDGSSISSGVSGAGSAGRIAMYFAENKTFSGSFDAYGGNAGGGLADGSPGTVFFYHTGTVSGHIYPCRVLLVALVLEVHHSSATPLALPSRELNECSSN